MWRCVDLVWTVFSEERIASVFGVEDSVSEVPAWAGGCRLGHQSKTYNLQNTNYTDIVMEIHEEEYRLEYKTVHFDKSSPTELHGVTSQKMATLHSYRWENFIYL
jgi:hypothetical protein